MKIGVDMDSVIADIMTPLIKYKNKRHKTNFSLKHQTDYNLSNVWKISPKEVINTIFDFYYSHYMDYIIPMPGAKKGIKMLKKHHDLHVITSRPHEIEEKSRRWLDKHFPNKFSEVYFTNQLSRSGDKKLKSHFCQKIGIELMIEDHLDFAYDCLSVNIPVILLDMPWNQKKNLPKEIKRVYSWEQIVKFF
jgi:uncharacterized HAD superfamily protein